jgi:hypothetical protein
MKKIIGRNRLVGQSLPSGSLCKNLILVKNDL